MSEYQRYEFLAIDRTLTDKEMSALRAVSTRAKITPRGFWNEYHWGDLKADPRVLLERYFDAHAYMSNWGARRLMLRLPATGVDRTSLNRYFVGHAASIRAAGKHVVIDLQSDAEDYDTVEDEDDERASLDALSPLRAELRRQDLRSAYLAWLLSVQSGELPDAAREPPVPAGLREPTPAQTALIDFLRIDPELVAAAALASDDASADDASADDAALRTWVLGLSWQEKDAWLVRAIDEPQAPLGDALSAAFRRKRAPPSRTPRRVEELLSSAASIRAEHDRAFQLAARKRELDAARKRTRALDALERRGDAAWIELEAKIEARDYDAAVALAVDLRDVAARGSSADHGGAHAFAERFDAHGGVSRSGEVSSIAGTGCNARCPVQRRKKREALPPRRLRMDRAQRLQAAKLFVRGFGGKRMVVGYARWFGVDRICAVTELQMLGVAVPAREVQIAHEMVQSAQQRRRIRIARTQETVPDSFFEFDDDCPSEADVVEWLRGDHD